jgi:hypothetical protein
MSIKSIAAKLFANYIYNKHRLGQPSPSLVNKFFNQLIQEAKETAFGKDHRFDSIKTFADFAVQVPVRDYEDLKPYVWRGGNILWKGKPLYFAKTSGTTSGAKYIPLTKESMPYHIQAARNAILLYIKETGNADFVDGKMIFYRKPNFRGKTRHTVWTPLEL